MSNTPSPRAIWLLALCAGGTLVLTLLQAGVFPSGIDLANGWRTPIIAFELARVPADLVFLAGPNAADVRDAMDAGHRLDTLFPFFYAGMLASGFATTGWRRRTMLVWVGISMLIVPFDLWENHVLGTIVAELRNGGTGEVALTWLPLATWSKWGLIGTALAGSAVAMRDRLWVAIPCVLAALFVPLACITNAAWSGESMALLVAAAFLVLMVRTVVLARRVVSGA